MKSYAEGIQERSYQVLIMDTKLKFWERGLLSRDLFLLNQKKFQRKIEKVK
jgi:hypothetical protein